MENFHLDFRTLNPISSEESDLSIVLKSFFSISLREVERDLGRVATDALILRSQEKKFRRKRASAVKSVDLAASYHRRFLLGSLMMEISMLPEELVLFSVSLPAYEIAEMACGISCYQGALKELGGIVLNCQESGMFEGYDSAVLRSDEILESVHDTMFLNALERYGLTKVTELYENDRPSFELQVEVGRRLVSPDLVDLEEHKKIEADFRKKFGPEFLQDFMQRLEGHGLTSF